MALRKYEEKFNDIQDLVYGALQTAYDEGYQSGRESNRHRGKNLVVSFDDENLGAVLTCAVRAALDAPENTVNVCGFVAPLVKYLDYKTLWTMEQDIKNNAAKITNGDPETAEIWNTFHRDVVVTKSRKTR